MGGGRTDRAESRKKRKWEAAKRPAMADGNKGQNRRKRKLNMAVDSVRCVRRERRTWLPDMYGYARYMETIIIQIRSKSKMMGYI
jgi:hypothetical protein